MSLNDLYNAVGLHDFGERLLVTAAVGVVLLLLTLILGSASWVAASLFWAVLLGSLLLALSSMPND